MNAIPFYLQSIDSLNDVVKNKKGNLIDWICRFQEASEVYRGIERLEDEREKQELLQKIEEVVKQIWEVAHKAFPRVSQDEFFRLATFHRNIQMYMKDKSFLTEENASEVLQILEISFPEGCPISAAASVVLGDHLTKLEFIA